MYDDLRFPLALARTGFSRAKSTCACTVRHRKVVCFHTVGLRRLFLFRLFMQALLARVEDTRYADTEGAALIPAAVSERWVIGCGRRQMPRLVGRIESRTMSCDHNHCGWLLLLLCHVVLLLDETVFFSLCNY